MSTKEYINKITCGDCLTLMKELDNNSVDLVLTDPPYGVNLSYDIYEDTEDNWFKMFGQLIPEIKRISSMGILPCCRIKALPWIYQNYPPDWLICWYKGSPGHSSFVGFNDWEPLLVYGKNRGIQMHDYLAINNTEVMSKDGHPCPKPIKWAKWLIKRTTNENDIVLDPFMGSGTTAVACQQLNRRWIGFEISQEYCDIANKRLAKLPNTKLNQFF